MKQAEQPRFVAPPGRRIIERPRLLNQLEDTNARTILLIAPAGYGKTTLARQWARNRSGVWWYTARSGSSDVAQLAAGLAESLDALQPGFHGYVVELLRALPNPSRQSPQIVEAFATNIGRGQTSTGVLDEYHVLAENPDAEAFVRDLHDHVGFRMLIASRCRPSWADARRELYGDLVELTQKDLALTDDESEEVLAHRLTRADLSVVAQAQGWPAVVGLAAMARHSSTAPRNAVASTLFRFLAEELFHSVPEPQQEQLATLALLPNFSEKLLQHAFGSHANEVMEHAIAGGFVTPDAPLPELHPLIREYLLTKLLSQPEARARAARAFGLSLEDAAYDHAFELIRRFTAIELLDLLIKASFKPLVLSGRIATLCQIATYARDAGATESPLVDLIDAELAFRDGRFSRAESLASRVARRLDSNHELRSRAHWLAGHAAQLGFDHGSASKHFRQADATARDDDDARDAIWGLVLTSLYSESPDAEDAVAELVSRRDKSPTDLVRAVTGSMQLMRYTRGLAEPLVVEDALHALSAVQDPRVRTSFTNTYAYQLLLSGRYQDALGFAEATLDDADAYQLAWTRPHAQWALAAAHLGLRHFGTADKWLQHVELAGEQLRDGHLVLNAASLRARLALAMQLPSDAHSALSVDETLVVNASMRGEFLATRALVLAVNGNVSDSITDAEGAVRTTRSVDAQALAACARAILAVRANAASSEFARWALVPLRLGVWDGLICALRAWPPLVPQIAAIPEFRLVLASALTHSCDFELAERAGLSLGRKPRRSSSTLSPREHEVLQLLRQGLTNAEIARALFISGATAKVHVQHILKKLGARTRTEAATRVLAP